MAVPEESHFFDQRCRRAIHPLSPPTNQASHLLGLALIQLTLQLPSIFRGGLRIANTLAKDPRPWLDGPTLGVPLPEAACAEDVPGWNRVPG